ncbi:MAG: PmoA family protein, partial [Planctomycetes bacterium]|nr:PmoA family protein [Planctomycetota bacterium]
MLTKRFLLGIAAFALVLALRALAQYHVAQLPTSDDGKRVTVKIGTDAVMVYRHGDAIKPYVEQLLTPSGVNVLRDSPSDHKHHHGIMFAVAVDGVNFWEEREPFGRQISRSTTLSQGHGVSPFRDI